MFFVKTIFIVIISYLIGSVSFAYLAGRLLRGINLREHGSGNLGASNALRVLGKWGGAGVLLLDAIKGTFCVWGADVLCVVWALPVDKHVTVKLCAATAVILGHVFTLYLGFKGGKGVATTLGAFLYLSFWPMLFALLVWSAVVFYSRYISLGSIIGACVLPLFVYLQRVFYSQNNSAAIFYFSLVVSILIILKHTSNIKRLISGTENKIGEAVKA